jgi:hypothetical protein
LEADKELCSIKTELIPFLVNEAQFGTKPVGHLPNICYSPRASNLSAFCLDYFCCSSRLYLCYPPGDAISTLNPKHLDSISAIHLATPNQRHITFCYPPGDAISRLVKWVGSPHYSIWCGLAYYFSSYLGAPTLPPREFMTYFEKGREKRKAGIGLGPEHRSWP